MDVYSTSSQTAWDALPLPIHLCWSRFN